MEAGPHSTLPAPVEGFNRRLEARFAWGSKDGRDPEAQTQAHDATDHVAILVGSLKAGVVVELGIGGEAQTFPVFEELVHDPLGRGLGGDRPGLSESTTQRDASEHIEARAVFDAQILDQIEAVEFCLSRGHRGEVPASGRWGNPTAAAAIESAPAFQDPRNRAHAGAARDWVLLQRTPQGRRAVLAEGAVLLKLLAQFQDQILDLLRRPIGRSARRLIAEVDAIQALVRGAGIPVLHLAQTDSELPGHGAL